LKLGVATNVIVIHTDSMTAEQAVGFVVRGIVPLDAAIDLPTLPSTYTPTEYDIQQAVNSFDANTDYPGLLDADIVET